MWDPKDIKHKKINTIYKINLTYWTLSKRKTSYEKIGHRLGENICNTYVWQKTW
jgi:hypothetical protein